MLIYTHNINRLAKRWPWRLGEVPAPRGRKDTNINGSAITTELGDTAANSLL